jgi:hypothetical protein
MRKLDIGSEVSEYHRSDNVVKVTSKSRYYVDGSI